MFIIRASYEWVGRTQWDFLQSWGMTADRIKEWPQMRKSWENMTKDEKSGNRMTKKWETNWAKMVKDEKPWKILR